MPEEEKSETSSSNKQKLKVVWLSLRKINIARIANLPYGAKRGFIERKALLKKGFIEKKSLLKEKNASLKKS